MSRQTSAAGMMVLVVLSSLRIEPPFMGIPFWQFWQLPPWEFSKAQNQPVKSTAKTVKSPKDRNGIMLHLGIYLFSLDVHQSS
jgi:hypothetical protein